jgi:hypothetical protein
MTEYPPPVPRHRGPDNLREPPRPTRWREWVDHGRKWPWIVGLAVVLFIYVPPPGPSHQTPVGTCVTSDLEH